MIIYDYYGNYQIYHAIIRFIVHLNNLLCNYLIYYAIKIISYTLNDLSCSN